ncbi:MAG: PilZ domain-containing protein, partial [Planctomycetota bacterium]|nr:PilZ domain-containing protein [Planctomycetota bacterium]
PPYKDTRHALSNQSNENAKLVEELKSANTGQTAAAIVNLMDAALRPGAITRLSFEGLEGGHACLVMGHDHKVINVTLPAHSNKLIAAIQPGMSIEGTLEHGASLIGFTSSVIQAVAGNMPYCRIVPWKSAWEIRKRVSVRLPAVLDIDFHHISTAESDSINMSNLEREIGALRPGRLIDLSHGGCCIETPSGGAFRTGDMIRFSRTLAPGDPPATFLGAIVKVDSDLDPDRSEGSLQRLHVQFLIIDDVSQRILVRALRQLQTTQDRNEWMQAQQLMQKIRRNNIENIGSPSATGAAPRRSGGTTNITARPAASAIPRQSTRIVPRQSTRSIPKPPGAGQHPPQ